MKKNEATFWFVAVAAAVLYGLMAGGRYYGGIYQGPPPTSHLLFHSIADAYGWLPSFLAGLIVRRRAALLALVIVLVGSFLGTGFRGYFAPGVVVDDWDPILVNQMQGILALLQAAVSAAGGQFLGTLRSSNQPLQPTPREDAHSG